MENTTYSKMPLIGDTAPSFTAITTQGPINFPDDFKGKWVILFSTQPTLLPSAQPSS
jgi:peroxiredoxin (alkyl hydroperoxide reductase subunit C)